MLGTISRKVTLHTSLIESEDQEKLQELLQYFWEKKFGDDDIKEEDKFYPDWTKDVDIRITKKMGKEEDDIITVEYKDKSVEKLDFTQLELFDKDSDHAEGGTSTGKAGLELSQSEIAERRRKAALETVDV
jgi:predicted TIM-barrel fold metal-dependent hydrolase